MGRMYPRCRPPWRARTPCRGLRPRPEAGCRRACCTCCATRPGKKCCVWPRNVNEGVWVGSSVGGGEGGWEVGAGEGGGRWFRYWAEAG